MTNTLRRISWTFLIVVAVLALAVRPSAVMAGPFEAAVKAYEADKFIDAERALRAILKKSPDGTQARLLLGWTVWNQGRYDESLLIFKRVLREAPSHRRLTLEEQHTFKLPDEVASWDEVGPIENPDISQARKGLGWTYLKKSWPRSAFVQFDLLQGQSEEWDEPYLGRGYAHMALGRLGKAKDDFSEYMKRTSKKRDGERAFGDLLVARKQVDKAIPHYEAALKLKPKWPEVQSALAWAYVAAGRHADAEKLFNALKRTRPIEWETGMARIALARGKFDEAEAALARALAASPYYGRAREVSRLLRGTRYKEFDKAWALYYRGKPKQAAAAFQALLKRPGPLPKSIKFSIFNGLGWARLALKKYEAAKTAFQASLKAFPNGAEATAGLGWIALHRKDLSAAEKAFTKAAAAAPRLIAARQGFRALRRARLGAYDEAWALYYRGKASDAVKAFRKLTPKSRRLSPATMAFARAGLAWAQVKLGKLAEAERMFAKLSGRSGNVGAEGKAGLGWIALKRKQPDRARARFLEALKLVPGHLAARRGLAALRRLEVPHLQAAWRAYYAGRFAEAADKFRSTAHNAKLKAEYRAEAARGLAWALLKGGNPKKALKAFDALVALSADADALYGRGLTLARAGRHADAIKPLKRAASLAPLSADIHLAHGKAVLESGDPKAAEAIFLAAYRLAPASAEVNRWIGWARVRQNRVKQALPAFRYALVYAPGSVDDAEFRKLLQKKEYRGLRRDLAWAYVRWSAFGRARPIFEKLVRENRHDGDAQFGLGYTLYKARDYKKADKALKRAIKAKQRPQPRPVWVVFPKIGSYPILTDASSIRGWVALFSKDIPGAIERFKESLDREPDLVSSLAGLGLALQKSGDREGAREAYLRASEIYPTYPVVVSGLRETQRTTTAKREDQ
ncbi:MAG: tetratricopeptide repeat protein [Candidatus Methylomirabilia bacterium]